MKRSSTVSIWVSSLTKLSVLLIVGVALGLWIGHIWMILALVLAGYLGWHLTNIYRLHRWLSSNRRFEPSQGIGLWADIFDRIGQRQKESSRRKQRLSGIVREFREATAALPDAIVVMDKQFNIVWCNNGAGRLLALHKTRDIGQPLTNLVRDPALAAWLGNVSDVPPEGLVINSPASGDHKLRLRLFDYANGQHLLVGRDITRIHQVEQMRRDFVANVSHELRTPLTVVSGYIETMADEIDEQWVPIIGRVEDQTARMRAIVEDLLTLSRLDSAEDVETEQLVAADHLARKTVESSQVLSEDQHEIIATVEPGLQLVGSQKDLNSCFTNLISNAVRYTPPGGKISISWSANDDGQAVFAVQDNGPGIAAQHIPRLTERFYRVSTDRSRSSGGTGLGLAIVKHILALHGAHLEIDSKLGVGSEFRCVFPAERVVRAGERVRHG